MAEFINYAAKIHGVGVFALLSIGMDGIINVFVLHSRASIGKVIGHHLKLGKGLLGSGSGHGMAVADLDATFHGMSSHTILIDGCPAHGHVTVIDIGTVA